ncbi:MAG TPA: DNA-processing protein DprA [Gemmatimonadaceae bacterium]
MSQSREPEASRCPELDPIDIIALTMMDDVGPATARDHLATIRSTSQPIDTGLDPAAFRNARTAARRVHASALRLGAECAIHGEEGYPESLYALQNPPVVLWTLGDMSVLRDQPVVSIVGTRSCTLYGERVTRELSAAFARAGVTVLSGLALGIDAMAHRATLEAGGVTAAVLGTGVDVPYPAKHRTLHRQILHRGVIVSEVPPGTAAGPGCFPRRNRIIAALGAATIVVEAPIKSGALITANEALTIGRTLAIVPGPIDSPQSMGSNQYMRDGGHPITCVADALALVGCSQPRPAATRLDTADERAVWMALENPAPNFDILSARASLPARLCLETVTALELRGLVECSLTGEIRRR